MYEQFSLRLSREQCLDYISLRLCHNNPINRVDPNGLTDFTFDKKNGNVKQVGEKNDDPDRILKTNRKGEVKYKKNGEAKVAVGTEIQGFSYSSIGSGDATDMLLGKYKYNLFGKCYCTLHEYRP